MNSYNIVNIGEEEVNIICDAYLNGDEAFYLSGIRYSFNRLRQFSIFEITSEFIPVEKIQNQNYNGLTICKKNLIGQWYYTPDGLKLFGIETTTKFIGHKAFGAGKNDEAVILLNSDLYINSDRISALEKIVSDEFDLTKLIKICQELNDNYSIGNYLSTGILLRALLDHISPIFKHDTFANLANQYGFAGTSFKKNMRHLQDSFRNIADSMLHSPIKRKEVLPTSQQIEFKADVDILLAEIIKILS
jgi:hypothetical protein